MKKYDKLIEDTTLKITGFQNGNKRHSASTLQSDLNLLHKAIKNNDEAGAEKAAGKLSGLKTVTIPATDDLTIKDVKKKNGKG